MSFLHWYHLDKRELVALLALSYWCIVTVSILWLFLTVSWVSLQHVIMVFSADPTHLPFVQYVKRDSLSLAFHLYVYVGFLQLI